MVFELDDQFDSYSDAATLASMQYEMHLSERGQKVESVQRMTATGKEPAAPGAAQTRVLPGTRDPLGMMQYLRNVDWTKTPEVRSSVYDGHKLYDLRANVHRFRNSRSAGRDLQPPQKSPFVSSKTASRKKTPPSRCTSRTTQRTYQSYSKPSCPSPLPASSC